MGQHVLDPSFAARDPLRSLAGIAATGAGPTVETRLLFELIALVRPSDDRGPIGSDTSRPVRAFGA